MKPTCDKSKCAPYSKSTSQSNYSNASARERGEHISHGNVGESSGCVSAKSHERSGHGSGGEHATHLPTGIQKALRGVSYPAKRQALVKTVQANGVVDSALKTLRDMPDDEYDTPVAASRAVNNEK